MPEVETAQTLGNTPPSSTVKMPTANYALFAIPAYWVIALVPHGYSIFLITSHNNNQFDLPSPRSTNNRALLEKSAPKDIYRRYERCRAAHDNMLESMAFVIGGILAGIMAKLDAGLMNMLSGLYIATRVAYAMSYINIASHKWATLRTLWFM